MEAIIDKKSPKKKTARWQPRLFRLKDRRLIHFKKGVLDPATALDSAAKYTLDLTYLTSLDIDKKHENILILHHPVINLSLRFKTHELFVCWLKVFSSFTKNMDINAKTNMPNIKTAIPSNYLYGIWHILQSLYSHPSLQTEQSEGIFRKSSDKVEKNKIFNELLSQTYDITKLQNYSNIHILANILCNLLTNLPSTIFKEKQIEILVTFFVKDRILKGITMKNTGGGHMHIDNDVSQIPIDYIKKLKLSMETLYLSNGEDRNRYGLMTLIFHLLKQIILNEKQTKQTAESLAIIFAEIFESKIFLLKLNDPMQVHRSKYLIKALIYWAYDIFPEQEWCVNDIVIVDKCEEKYLNEYNSFHKPKPKLKHKKSKSGQWKDKYLMSKKQLSKKSLDLEQTNSNELSENNNNNNENKENENNTKKKFVSHFKNPSLDAIPKQQFDEFKDENKIDIVENKQDAKIENKPDKIDEKTETKIVEKSEEKPEPEPNKINENSNKIDEKPDKKPENTLDDTQITNENKIDIIESKPDKIDENSNKIEEKPNKIENKIDITESDKIDEKIDAKPSEKPNKIDSARIDSLASKLDERMSFSEVNDSGILLNDSQILAKQKHKRIASQTIELKILSNRPTPNDLHSANIIKSEAALNYGASETEIYNDNIDRKEFANKLLTRPSWNTINKAGIVISDIEIEEKHLKKQNVNKTINKLLNNRPNKTDLEMKGIVINETEFSKRAKHKRKISNTIESKILINRPTINDLYESNIINTKATLFYSEHINDINNNLNEFDKEKFLNKFNDRPTYKQINESGILLNESQIIAKQKHKRKTSDIIQKLFENRPNKIDLQNQGILISDKQINEKQKHKRKASDSIDKMFKHRPQTSDLFALGIMKNIWGINNENNFDIDVEKLELKLKQRPTIQETVDRGILLYRTDGKIGHGLQERRKELHKRKTSQKIENFLLYKRPTQNELKENNILMTNEKIQMKKKHKRKTSQDLEIGLKNRIPFNEIKYGNNNENKNENSKFEYNKSSNDPVLNVYMDMVKVFQMMYNGRKPYLQQN